MEEEIYEIQLVLNTEYGEYRGEKRKVTKSHYDIIIQTSKSYYNGGFELSLEDSSYVIFSPEIVKKSILSINKTDLKNKKNV